MAENRWHHDCVVGLYLPPWRDHSQALHDAAALSNVLQGPDPATTAGEDHAPQVCRNGPS